MDSLDLDKLSREDLERLAAMQEELEKREIKNKYKEDFVEFAEKEIKIRPKDIRLGLVPLQLNEAQKIIHEKLEEQKKKTGMVRAVILKGRQQGISTYCSARNIWLNRFMELRKTTLIAHDATASGNLFEMAKNAVEELSDEIKPTLGAANARQLVFADNKASFTVKTAGNKDAGRGETPTSLHASEVAFWQHADDIISGLEQGIPQNPETEIIYESTANGASGLFYELFTKAQEEYEKGNSIYMPIFLPWFITKEYSTPIPEGTKLDLSLADKEYQEKYDLTNEQMYWRKLKINASGPEKFMQEYPANSDEAFLASGSSTFSVEVLNKTQTSSNAKSVKTFSDEDGMFHDDVYGHLEVWRNPGDYKTPYLIGADVAGGYGMDHDYSVAVVMNVQKEIVALFRSNIINPGDYGSLLFYLGRMFNNALICVESNNMGVATLQRLQDMRYCNLYFSKRQLAMVSHAPYNDQANEPGFKTTHSTKQAIIANLGKAILDKELLIHSSTVLQELKNYITLSNGRTEAAPGHHDDCVMALALALEVHRTDGEFLKVGRPDWEGIQRQYQVKETTWI